MEVYGPHRCYFPRKGGGWILLTWEHTIAAINAACGY